MFIPRLQDPPNGKAQIAAFIILILIALVFI